MHCQDCRHWQRRELYQIVDAFHRVIWVDNKPTDGVIESIAESSFGICHHDAMIYCSTAYRADDEVKYGEQPDAVLLDDGEGYGIQIKTGKDFGCIHFEALEP